VELRQQLPRSAQGERQAERGAKRKVGRLTKRFQTPDQGQWGGRALISDRRLRSGVQGAVLSSEERETVNKRRHPLTHVTVSQVFSNHKSKVE
jgi:hypothetical protein